MNKQGNLYTVIYIVVLVLVVGAGLAITSISLKDRQKNNADADKMRQILASVNIEAEGSRIAEEYNKYIIDSYIVDYEGNKVDVAEDAFNVNIARQIKKTPSERLLPVYECRLDDGSVKYVIPMYGAGLWGPIWGYVSVDSTGSTIYGSYFAHQGETPGLGAEIEKSAFSSRFIGKHLVKGGAFVPVVVVKAGQHPLGGEDYIDAISGATITSKGVSAMIENCIAPYGKFLESLSEK